MRNDFFFQAEDGIRDHCVTGVQTCALPISAKRETTRMLEALGIATLADRYPHELSGGEERSEERRVGKECRSRRARYRKTKHKVVELAWNGTQTCLHHSQALDKSQLHERHK